jgi:AcrR family transcriptional regulator
MELDERREQLMHVGRDLFSRRPYHDVSIEEIAAAAGISRGLLYHYFPSKREFYIEVLREVTGNLVALFELRPADPPDEQIKLVLGRVLGWLREHGTGYLTYVRGGVAYDPVISRIVADVRSAGLRSLAQARRPDLAEPQVQFHLRGWIGYFEALGQAWLEDGTPDVEDVLDLALRALDSGVQVSTTPDAGTEFEDRAPTPA